MAGGTFDREWALDGVACRGQDGLPLRWGDRDGAAGYSGLCTHLLDELAFGIALVDARSRLEYANRPARRALAVGDVVRLSGDRVVAARDRSARRFRLAIERAATGAAAYVDLGEDGDGLGVLVAPASGGDGIGSAAVTLAFGLLPDVESVRIDSYARAHRLTNAESRVLQEVADGTGIDEAAARIGIKPNTARAHVRAVLRKTGQGSLRRLAAKIGALPPVLPTRGACVD